MLIAVTVDKERKLSLNMDDTEHILIFSRKFDRVKHIDTKHKVKEDFIDTIRGCKYIISRHIHTDLETSNAITDLGIKIISELRTRDPFYAIRLI